MVGQESLRRKNARHLLVKSGYKAGGSLSEKVDEAADKKMIKRAIAEHDRQLHHGQHTRLHLAEGGPVDGDTPRHRGDRSGRGKGAKNHIAIIVAPGAGGGGPPGPGPAAAMPPPPRPPIPAGGPPPGVPPMPPPGAMPPPGIGPGAAAMPPPGIGQRPGVPGVPPMPMMRKRGGRAGWHEEDCEGGAAHEHHARGGRALKPGHATSIADEMPMPSGNPRHIETAAAQGQDFLPGEKHGGRAHHAKGGQVGSGTHHMTAGAGSGEGQLEKIKGLHY